MRGSTQRGHSLITGGSGTRPAELSTVVRHRLWLWVLLGTAGVLAVILALAIAAVPLTADALRHRMIRTLSDRLDADVAIGDLHWRVFPQTKRIVEIHVSEIALVGVENTVGVRRIVHPVESPTLRATLAGSLRIFHVFASATVEG